MKIYKVTSPMGTNEYTATEWIEFGEQKAKTEVKYAQRFDPDVPNTITLEIVERE